ncbi:MAG: SusD/RagB family nutrient-binding outer membrane lipoprotein [Lewinellaceae bacterium]|nr:SusD/RagB family nutrient-binding outer membrane lipoprotein [Lewinellaceae bacterium]
MKNKYILKALAVALLLFAGSACDKFEVDNLNPDVATSIKNNPELLLTNFLSNSVRRSVESAWSEGNLMAQYGARIVFTEFDLFEWGSQSGLWETYYLAIRDAKELEKIAIATENPSYEAVSVIWQSWLFQILTDVYGDIPYSQASLANADDPVFTPAYDTQETIYLGLLEDLKRANTLLSQSNLPSIKGDILFDGDMGKWRKFANSLRLRVAMRLSNVSPAVAEANIAEIAGKPSEFPVMESNADNAALAFLSTNPNSHPITEESVYRVGSFNEYRISETVEGLLREFDDPRLFFWADPTANSVMEGDPMWSGMQNGIVDGPAYVYKGGDAFLSKFNIEYFFFSPNSNQGRLMIYSEVALILAEAAMRGWIGLDGKALYEMGVTANFEYWNVEMPQGYLQRPGVAYNGELEPIANQKYLALFYTDFQGFIEYKRTGFPNEIAPGPDAFLPNYPSRFLYPSKEAALNGANLQEAISRQGPDELSTPVWWEGN